MPGGRGMIRPVSIVGISLKADDTSMHVSASKSCFQYGNR